MKPIHLKMTAFGPYKQAEIVDFAELKDHRLFLISGPTGAGKTSIFDAICFALYGTSSGTDRDQTRMLRSDFAEDDTHTSVEFIFEIRNRKYRVLRQLGHVKEGRKTATGEKYELYEILSDGSEVSVVERQRVSDINPKLEEIVGLTYDQFSQIVMLPQGEFRKLLTSQSENKEAILRKIFKTDRYGKMAKVLEEKKLKAESDARAVKAMRDSYIEQISGALPIRESELFIALQRQSNIYQIGEALEAEALFYAQEKADHHAHYEKAKEVFQVANETYIAAKSINDQLDALELAKQQLTKSLEQVDHYESLKAKAEAGQRANTLVYLDEQCLSLNESIKGKEHALNDANHHVMLAEQSLEQSKKIFEQEKENEAIRKQLADSIHKLQSMQPIYEQVNEVQKKWQLAEQNAASLKQKYEQAVTQLETMKLSAQKMKADISSLEAEVAKRPAVMEKVHRLQAVTTLYKQLSEDSGKLQSAQVMFESTHNYFEQKKEQYEAYEKEWLNNQAYVLASSLHDGDPCPVCGSVDHPNKHVEHGQVVDQSALKKYKDQLNEAETSRQNSLLQLNLLTEKVKQYEVQLSEYEVHLHERSIYEQQLQEMQAYNVHLEQESIRLTNLKQQEAQLFETIAEQEQSIKATEHAKIEAEKAVVEHATSFNQMKANMDPAIANLAALLAKLNEQSNQLVALEKSWEQAQTALQQNETAVVTKKQLVTFLTEQLEELKVQLATEKQKFMDKMKEAQFENYSLYKQSILTDGVIRDLLQQHLSFSNSLHALKQKVAEESERLKNNQKVDLTDASTKLQMYKLKEEQAYEQYKLAEKYEEQCSTFTRKLNQVAEDIYRLEQVSNQITDVYNLLKGQNTKKISFERYVQIGYLEQITEAANIRLRTLSNGQYMLICSDRQESHGRQSGLSLDVYDSYTGQTRDVKSLSGGEKFNASLSLALGMADVIQSYQGNVRIDTMFIDEGFGSLDEESLMRAIDTLIELQNAGRMIGVISHVSELKEAIPAVLQVMKLKEGYSRTQFIVN
jgi:DNA repair protein SbcC/Rad50